MIQQIIRIFAMLDAPTRRGLVLICVLIAENGKLFGVGAQYGKPAADAGH